MTTYKIRVFGPHHSPITTFSEYKYYDRYRKMIESTGRFICTLRDKPYKSRPGFTAYLIKRR